MKSQARRSSFVTIYRVILKFQQQIQYKSDMLCMVTLDSDADVLVLTFRILHIFFIFAYGIWDDNIAIERDAHSIHDVCLICTHKIKKLDISVTKNSDTWKSSNPL